MENIAQTSGKLFLPKVADAIFKIKGVIAFIAKANTAAQVNIATTQDQKRAGQTNSVIGVITTEKTVDVSFTTPEWQPEFLAANIGTVIKYGKQNFVIDNVPYTVGDNGILTLEEHPVDHQIQIEINGSWTSVPVEDDKKEVDLSTYGIAAKTCVNVICLLPREGKEISLLTDTDPTIGELILTSPIFKGTKGQVGTAQYTFPAFALSGNWTQAFSSDASYEIKGTAVSVAGEKCGESNTYGYYREYIEEDSLNSYVSIVAAPSIVELKANDKQTLTVYGIRGALSDKALITDEAVFAVPESGTSIASVTKAGEITALAEGETTVDVTVGGLKTSVAVKVTATATA